MAQTTHVTVDEALYDIVVGHLHDSRHTAKSFNILLWCVGGVLILHLAIALAQISLGHVELEQTVEVECHGLGKLDELLVALHVSYRNLILDGDEQAVNLFFFLLFGIV